MNAAVARQYSNHGKPQVAANINRITAEAAVFDNKKDAFHDRNYDFDRGYSKRRNDRRQVGVITTVSRLTGKSISYLHG